MKLQEIISNVNKELVIPAGADLTQEIYGITTSSKKVGQGYLFLGLPGSKIDGGEFWVDSFKSGAVAAVITPQAAQKVPPHKSDCVIQCQDIESVCAQIAAAFYDFPSLALSMIGVTGTNGKTTTTHLIEFFMQQISSKIALFGTLYTRWPNHQKTALHTTPFAVELQSELANARLAGCKYSVMEVSSHALAQGRIKECMFDVSVFTNLTQDHLDYHLDMESYFQAKELLFSEEYLSRRAIINIDDIYGQRLSSTLPKEKVWTYSVDNEKADFHTKNLKYKVNGASGIIITPMGSFTFNSPLVGKFNLSNLLASVATIAHFEVSLELTLKLLPDFKGVPGRMERVSLNDSQDIAVIVDYAHTPDSLENLLKATRPFIDGKIICVFGCGGDRDRTKRPLMGKISSELADITVVTSDNPRTENPQSILDDILQGIGNQANVSVLADRALAIKKAILEAKSGDGILIAGKGHEDYQIIGSEKFYFDDRQEALKALKERGAKA